MQTESIYWLFSSSAQSISALVAFLIAGLALVHTMMENSQQRDDTLIEIHTRLKTIHYKFFKYLAIGTVLAVGLSLSMLAINPLLFPGKIIVVFIIGFFNIIVLGGAFAFVLLIINPDKYQATAKNLINEERKQKQFPKATRTDQDFFIEFIKLESAVRNLLKRKRLFLASQGSPNMSYSFREMVDTLINREVISYSFYKELQEINKYRNLVFHGHEHEIDQVLVDRIREAKQKINKLAPRKSTSKSEKG